MAESEVARRLKEVRAKRKEPDVNTVEYWMRQNFDELQRERNANEVTYEEIAEVAASLGVKNMRGNAKPSAAVVRKFFLKVARERAEKTLGETVHGKSA